MCAAIHPFFPSIFFNNLFVALADVLLSLLFCLWHVKV